jgi:Bacterial Ig-like domain (group 3)
MRRLLMAMLLVLGSVAPLFGQQQPTRTVLTSSASPAEYGSSVMLTAGIAPPTRPITGSVQFTDGGVPLGLPITLAGQVATLTISTLTAGGHDLTAVYSGDTFNLTSTSPALIQLVTPGITAVAWAPSPNTLLIGSSLGPAQLNATASTAYFPSVPGTFTYTPPAGTVLAAGQQTLTVMFTPTDATDFAAAKSSATITVLTLSLTSISATSALLGDPAKTIILTGTGFVADSQVQINGAAIQTTLINPTTLSAVIPASNFLMVQTLQVAVVDPTQMLTSSALPLTVTAPPVNVMFTGPSTTPSSQQPNLTFQLTNPYRVPLNGIFTLTFAPISGGVDDPAIQFATGGRTQSFTIAANSTATPPVQLQSGTVAGVITIALALNAGGANVTPSTLQPVVIQVPPAVPNLSAVTLTRNGDSLTVVVIGYSNTREVVTANFHFVAANGSSIQNPDLSLPASALFTPWYAETTSAQFGSGFSYTQIFTVDRGASVVEQVQVTLMNTVGASAVGSTP